MAWTETLPSGKYRAGYRTPAGEKRYVKGTFAHKKRALNEAAAAEKEASEPGWRDPKAKGKTWGEWCDTWWKTRDVAPGTLARDLSPLERHIRPKWGEVALADITRFDIKAWIADLLQGVFDEDAEKWVQRPLKPTSVQRYFSIFGASLTAAVDAEVIASDPSYKIKIAKGEVDERHYLKHEEAGLLIAQFAPPVAASMDLPLVLTLLGTGMRWGEAVGLQVERVDFERMVIRVAETWDSKSGALKDYPKGKKRRNVPVPAWLESWLRWSIGDRTSGFAFGAPQDIDNWRKRVWDGAVDRACIGHVRIHDLRHTFASWLLQRGVKLADVGHLLGHVSTATTERYAHLAEEFGDDVVQALSLDPRGANVGQSAISGHGEALSRTVIGDLEIPGQNAYSAAAGETL